MRVRARKDANHAEIVKTFRELGAQVVDLANIGNGVPDLLVSTGKRTFLVEVKDGSKPPSQQKLTTDEKEFHSVWRGELFTITSIPEAINLIMTMRKP